MSEPVLRCPPRPVVSSGKPRRTSRRGGGSEPARARVAADPAPYDWAVEIPEWHSGHRKPRNHRARIPILADLPDLLAIDNGAPNTAPGGTRLTRRGRVVLVATLTVAATSALTMLFLTAATAGDTDTASAASAASESPGDRDDTDSTVVVEDGDTLWAIAEQARPGEDPRRTVHEIVEMNELDESNVDPGQEIVIPGS